MTDVNKLLIVRAYHTAYGSPLPACVALTYRPSDYLMADNILHDTSHWLPGASSRRKQHTSTGV